MRRLPRRELVRHSTLLNTVMWELNAALHPNTPRDRPIEMDVEVTLEDAKRAIAWARCPEHGPFCPGDGDYCCCSDKHRTTF